MKLLVLIATLLVVKRKISFKVEQTYFLLKVGTRCFPEKFAIFIAR